MLSDVPVQADISLQNAAGHVGPEIDVPVGTVHFTQIREPADDLRAGIDRIFSQPLLVAVSTRATSQPE